MESQPPQVVGHASLGALIGRQAQEGRERLSQLAVGEATGTQSEEQESQEEGLDARIPEAETGGALAVDALGVLDALKRVFAERTVMAEALDVEQTSVGGEADLPQRREVVQPSADREVVAVVDDRLRAQSPVLLEVLLDPAVLVVDMQRGQHALGDHPGAEATRGPAADAAVEDQLHLIRTPQVEVVADHLLEEHAPLHPVVEHLGERKLRLEDRKLIAIARTAVRRRERM